MSGTDEPRETHAAHKPFTDDGVTYCGWDGHDGCGKVWPCPSAAPERTCAACGQPIPASEQYHVIAAPRGTLVGSGGNRRIAWPGEHVCGGCIHPDPPAAPIDDVTECTTCNGVNPEICSNGYHYLPGMDTDPNRPAYDAVYAFIGDLGQAMPPDPVHRNAMIWRAVTAALGAVGQA